MAGTCVPEKRVAGALGMTIVEWHWTSDSSGAVSGVGAVAQINGRLEQVEFIPAAGASQPTDAYDVTLPDQYGRDVLMGVGANVSNVRSNTAVNVRTPVNADLGHFTAADLTLSPVIANAGNAKSGIIRAIFR